MSIEHRLHARCACGSSLSHYESRGASAPQRPFVLAGIKRVYERPRPFAIQHICIEMVLDVPSKAFSATTRLDIRRIDKGAKHIVLDAVSFDLKRVEIGSAGAWKPAEHTYDGAELQVRVPDGVNETQIRVEYRATPRRGMYFLSPDEHVKTRPNQVWTQCQDEDARHVFPCHDKTNIKQTTELVVTVPDGWVALSNGVLVDDGAGNASKQGAPRVFHWKMEEPHSSYLFSLVAGEFSVITDDADGVPVTYWVPKGREEDGRRTFRRTPEMIKRFGALTGVRYPWNKYAQIVVNDFIFGGMENTTATTMYEHILLDDRAAIDVTADDLIAHELAHQWFGDFVTCRDWSHGWLNEGFATFMEHVDREAHLGRDEYDYGLWLDFDLYTTEARSRYKRPIVCQDYEAPIDIFDRHLYEKGALVLHTLRRELGDDAFWKGVGTYLTRHAKSTVQTVDLQRALEDVSGKSLERFFEQWVMRAGHPELDVKISYDDGALLIAVKQVQANATSASHASSHAAEASVPVFAFDLAVDVATSQGVKREVRRVDQTSQTFVIPMDARPHYVVVDPDFAVPAEMRLDAPADLLRAQLEKAPTARGRMLAAGPLGRKDDPPTCRALAASLANESEFWGTRVEAAAALGQVRSDEALEALLQHVGTAHPKVRRGVASALGHFRKAKAADALKKMALADASYLVEAEAARSLGNTRQPTAFDTLIDVLDRQSWADVVRAGALDGLGNLRDDRAVPHVTARTRYGIPTRGRRAAIMALPKLAWDKKARETLEDLLDGTDPYLRVDVVRAIADLGDTKSRGALQRQLDRELDGRVRRRIREVLRDLGGGAKRDVDKLRDELEALRNDHAELKTRLGKLEAKQAPPEESPAPAAKAKKPNDKRKK